MLDPTEFSSANALTSLLTTESLLFAVFGLTVSLGGSPAARIDLASPSRALAVVAACVLTLLALGAAVSWVDLFIGHWPGSFARWFPICTIALGIITQPMFAWMFVRSLFRRPLRDATDSPWNPR